MVLATAAFGNTSFSNDFKSSTPLSQIVTLFTAIYYELPWWESFKCKSKSIWAITTSRE
jgi:hypothetical protein